MSKHCLSVTDSIASTTPKFIVPGTESLPTPSTLYFPAAKTPRSTGLPSPWYAPYITEPTGSGIKTLTWSLDASFKYLPVPETVPPVLPPAMKCVTRPLVCFQISGPSVR